MSDTMSTPAPTEPTSPAPPNAPDAPPVAPRSLGSKLFLFVTAVLFVGWMSWLGYTALTRGQTTFVSRAQAAGAKFPVVAELTDGEEGRPAQHVTVAESWKGAPEKGAAVLVLNLPECTGYTGPGTYLLLLNADPGAPFAPANMFVVAGGRGAGSGEAGALRVYPWNATTSADLRAQVEKLFP